MNILLKLVKIFLSICNVIAFSTFKIGEIVRKLKPNPMDKLKPQIYTFKLYHINQIHPNNETIPHSRSGHRIVCDENNLYSYGGYHPQHSDEHSEGTLFRELWKFNFASKLWTLLPFKESIPAEVASSALLFDGNTIMVYGGTGIPFGIECSNRLYCCSVINYTGMELIETKGNKPLPMYGQALVYKNGFLYTIGGTTGYNYNCEIHRLNLTSKEWDFIQPRPGDLNVPEGRYRHEIAFDGKFIYVFGGGTVVRCYNFKHIPAFNLDTLSWERIDTIPDEDAGYPTPRMCHGCVQRKTEEGCLEVYILGGYVKVHQSLNDFWKFEFKTRTWTLLTDHPLKMPVHFNSVSITPQGKIYIFGGVYKVNNQRTNDLHEAWVCIPKLSEISWEAVLFYIPSISKIDKSRLLNLGIPSQFVNRIDFSKNVVNKNFLNASHL